jgi:2'-5' RNA ligase
MCRNHLAFRRAAQPFRINFDDVACGASFHQCTYILCAKEPALLAANAAAREAFGKAEPGSPYMPHLSLLYSGDARGTGGRPGP